MSEHKTLRQRVGEYATMLKARNPVVAEDLQQILRQWDATQDPNHPDWKHEADEPVRIALQAQQDEVNLRMMNHMASVMRQIEVLSLDMRGWDQAQTRIEREIKQLQTPWWKKVFGR